MTMPTSILRSSAGRSHPLLLAGLLGGLLAAPVLADPSAKLVVMIDTSGDMARPAGPRASDPSRFDTAVEWAAIEAEAHLSAGGVVEVRPIFATPTPAEVATWPQGNEAVPAQVAGIVRHLNTFRPARADGPRGAVEAAVRDALAGLSPDDGTVVVVYTTGDGPAAAARVTLGTAAKVRIVPVTTSAKAAVRPPSVRVRVEQPSPLVTPARSFDGGAVVPMNINVGGVFTGKPGIDDSITAVVATVVPRTPGSPPLKVIASLPTQLTPTEPTGIVRVKFTGNFPPGGLRHEYDLLLTFDFASSLPSLPNRDRRQQVPAGQAIRIIVAAQPEAGSPAIASPQRREPLNTPVVAPVAATPTLAATPADKFELMTLLLTWGGLAGTILLCVALLYVDSRRTSLARVPTSAALGVGADTYGKMDNGL